jgi:hypothetical protein
LPSPRVLLVYAWRMVVAVVLGWLLLRLAAELDAPVVARALLLVVVLVYVVRLGHYALWPRTPSGDFSMAAALVAALVLQVFALVTWAFPAFFLALVGLRIEDALSLTELVPLLYVLFWMLRVSIADQPRLLAARHLLWFLVVLSLLVAGADAFGVDVTSDRVDPFYTTVAQVDAALLLAAAFQSAWARRIRVLEGMVFVAVFALTVSLTCSFIALGRGADSSSLLAFTVAGLAAGLVLVATGVVRQVAPDVLEGWGPRVVDRLVGDELMRHDWAVKYPRNRRRLAYDLRAERRDGNIRVGIKFSDSLTNPKLTPIEWDCAKKQGRSYVLAVVDFFGSEQQHVWYVRDPTATALPIERAIPTPPVRRVCIEPLAVDARLL